MSTSVIQAVAGTATSDSFVTKTVTFTGAANLGAVGSVPIFTVNGEVLITYIAPFTTVDLISGGGGSIALGVTGATSLFSVATVATTLDVGEFWLATSIPAGAQLAVGTSLSTASGFGFVITENIIGTVTTADITAGAIRFDIFYRQLSSDGAIV